ncbi:MAG: sigma-54-dependent Fis family transcriptional regulator [Gemmatimonadetes bacterium]|nr:sigma-54-dependent Fis family transcriptional regulator [Gemmatimonadota bacterium]
MQSRLTVVALSDSFESFWPELARSAEAGLEVISEPQRAGPGAAFAFLLACGGAEDDAPDALRQVLAAGCPAPAVVGARADHRLAVELVRRGAADYFVLPDDADRLRDWVKDRAEAAKAQEARAELAESSRREFDFSRIIGRSPAMREALEKAARIIPRDRATVLISGETGTGKELVAQAIHYNGPRASAPFVEVNCSAIPANLLESELFGYERGAFTDAKRAKPGLLEAANGGTLLLDEIAAMPLDLQGKILKALEEKRVRRLGSTATTDVDVRIIAATNTDLASAVRTRAFREDLYYRLSVFVIHLPPLRERGDDILLLVEHFLDLFTREYGVLRPELGSEVKRQLLLHRWPGNVRELRNAIERAVLLSDGGAIMPEHLFPEPTGVSLAPGRQQTGLPFPAPLREIEDAAATEMVKLCNGNKSAAARRLGISRTRLLRILDHANREPGTRPGR